MGTLTDFLSRFLMAYNKRLRNVRKQWVRSRLEKERKKEKVNKREMRHSTFDIQEALDMMWNETRDETRHARWDATEAQAQAQAKTQTQTIINSPAWNYRRTPNSSKPPQCSCINYLTVRMNTKKKSDQTYRTKPLKCCIKASNFPLLESSTCTLKI